MTDDTTRARTLGRRTRWLIAVTALVVMALGVSGATAMIQSGQTVKVAAANASADLDQCANGSGAPQGQTCDWVNGNLGASKAFYLEGDSIAYRLRFDNLTLASHTVTIEWDTTKSDKHAIDYLTTFNRTITNADPCLGVTGCSASTTHAIPADPQVTGAGVTPVAGNFTLYGGTITAVSAYSYPDGSGFTGDKSARITLTFTPTSANPVLAWGGHIATRQAWGMGNSAVNIPGSPYHTRLIDLDGSGGNQDRSLSAEAVVFPGSITVVKQATPEGSWSFPFTASPSPLTNFSLVDDGTSANTKVFSNITNFQSYSIGETVPSGWTLDSAGCTVTAANGGSFSVSLPSVSIDMKEGENWTCTFNDTAQPAHLIVIKHVINDNGGTKVASDFAMTVTGTSPSPSSFPGAESPGTSVTLGAGSYSVGEGSVTGYTASYSADCTGTLAPGQTKTCTVTNDDNAAHLIVIKHVINDNGGSKTAADFTMTIGGVTASGGNSFAGAESPGTDKTLTTVGSYNVTEGAVTGYTASYSADCTGTIALGETKTCTVTNDDNAAHLVVIKHVINDNGGSAAASDFTMTIGGVTASGGNSFAGAESPGTDKTLTSVGSYTVTEGAVTGYTASYSADCTGTIALGETKTCTVTNNDQPAHLIVIKHVINDNGGTKTAADFTMTIGGVTASGGNSFAGAESPGTDKTLTTVGSYNVTEGTVTGYTASYSADCTGTIALGETKTCTVTNDDQAAKLIVIKHVINDNGGTKTAADFSITVTGSAPTPASFAGAESPGTEVAINAGSYSVGESPVSGYTGSYSADCTGTIALGETKTCTVTNNDQPAHLIVIKHVINDNGGSAAASDFTMSVTASNPSPASFAGAESPGTNVTVDAGAYSVGESGPAGYAASYSADCTGTLALGETKTCTVTNNDIAAHLIVIKHVVNDNGGTKTAADFTMTIGGVTASGGNSFAGAESPGVDKTLTSIGSYNVTEGAVYGYTGSYSADCTGTIALGQTKTCTVTNDDQPGHIVVVKVSKPADTGSFDFTTTGSGYSPFTLPGGGQNSQTLDAGTYSVTESTQLGWVLTGIGGDSQSPYNCVVTGSGGSTGVGDLATQTATISLKNGDTVTCTFENTGQGVTRTQGFWATHTPLADIAWFGGTAFGHTFPGVANVAGIGDTLLCGRPIDTLGKLMGGFWSNISKKSTGVKRSSLDQSRMQLLQQLLAAELNASAFGAVPSGGIGMFATWEAAYCGTNQSAIQAAQSQSASFNTSGDSGVFTPGTSADSKYARSIANLAFWDTLP